MKKRMPIFVIVIISLFFIFGFNSTEVEESPKVVVDNMFKKIEEGNYEDINKPLEDMYKSSDVSKVPDEIYENLYKSIKYEIGEENINKKTATVTVKVNGISYNDIFTMAALKVYEANYDETGNKNSTEQKNETELVIESLVEFSKSGPRSDKNVTVNLTLENSKWKPIIDKSLWNEILGVSAKGN